MKRVIANYMKWKHSHLKGIRVVKIQREYDQMLVVYTYKVGGIFSRKREQKIIRLNLWEMVEFLYFYADGRTH
jgi:hypothetical protein